MIVAVDGIRPGWQNKTESALFNPNVFYGTLGLSHLVSIPIHSLFTILHVCASSLPPI